MDYINVFLKRAELVCRLLTAAFAAVPASIAWGQDWGHCPEDSACCATICANYSPCCDVDWDSTCACYASVDCGSAFCGDGIVDICYEICDDGNTTDGDGCDSSCTRTGCGNGIITSGETCDDGNTQGGDGCSSGCQACPGTGGSCVEQHGPGCEDEACCSSVCAGDTFCCDVEWDSICVCEAFDLCGGGSVCGDGFSCGDEECDDGNTDDGDGCSSTCQIEFACPGDGSCFGVPDPGCEDEACCESVCGIDSFCCEQFWDAICFCESLDLCGSGSVCGDGFICADEECDDGNTYDDDGCDSNCTPTGCGNGIITDGELCDDGNTTERDGCDFDCTPTGCGNGIITEGEMCDDGNTTDGDGCSSTCGWEPLCGNGNVDPGEFCDDGNQDNWDGCRSDCTLPFCGDGGLDDGEMCDDGNTTDGDGCSSTCQAEPVTNNGLTFFFDTRNSQSDALIDGGALGNNKWFSPIAPWKNEPYAGGRGDAQVRFVSPVVPAGSHVFLGHDSSRASIYLYMDVADRAGDGDIVSSVGVDIGITKESGELGLDAGAGVEPAIFNDAGDVGGGAAGAAWDAITPGTVDVNGVDGMILSRTPSYPNGEGLRVGGSYRLAQLTFQGGPRGALPTSVGVYHLQLSVNEGLITRAYDPNGPTGDSPELPDFGYVDGAPEAASVAGVSGANGGSEGTTSPTADAMVIVQPKADMDGNGSVDLADITLFVNVFNRYPRGLNTVTEIWRADIDDNNTLTIADISGMIASFFGWPQ